jgi:hypothetical protein
MVRLCMVRLCCPDRHWFAQFTKKGLMERFGADIHGSWRCALSAVALRPDEPRGAGERAGGDGSQGWTAD